MKQKSPAFQLYASDLMSDQKFIIMSLEERGAYLTLLCSAWLDGSIPNDTSKLARICGVSDEDMERIWPAIKHCFEVEISNKNNSLSNKRLEVERKKQQNFRKKQSENVKKRWTKGQDTKQDAYHGNTNGGNTTVIPARVYPSSSSSSSSPSPPPNHSFNNRYSLPSNLPEGKRRFKKPITDRMKAQERFWILQEQFGFSTDEEESLTRLIMWNPESRINEAEAALRDKIDSEEPPKNRAAYFTACVTKGME